MTLLVPLFEERALLLEDEGSVSLVAGDLHLGLEAELRRKGLHGLDASRELVEHLGALALAHDATRILLLGDVKHSLGAREAEARALAPLAGLPCPVEVVPGNHDGALAEVAPFLALHDARGIVRGGVGLVHGHTWPHPALFAQGRLVLSHNHPQVALVDELGGVTSEPCWARAPLGEAVLERYPDAALPGEAILVPAFNPLLGGVALNRTDRSPLGPLLTHGLLDLPQARIYTLDGVDLGLLGNLEAAP